MFKKTVLCTTLLALSAWSMTAQACTRVLWDTPEQGTFVGRTMDWSESTDPHIVNYPANTHYPTHLALKNTVPSKYAVTGITAYGILMDGINSEGLGGNVLYDAGMTLNSTTEQAQKAGAITYLRHLLSQNKSVAEAVQQIRQNSPIEESINGIPVRIALHISLQDSTGDSAIIEWRDGKPQIWHGKEYTVLTNQPDYPVHLNNVEKAKPTWGAKNTQSAQTALGSKGNINPEDRFLHATYFSQHLKAPTGIKNGLLKLDSVLFKIPHDAPNRVIDGKMTGYATEYTVMRHIQSGTTVVRYQWGESFHQVEYNVKELQEANKSVQFNLAQPHLAGDITEAMLES